MKNDSSKFLTVRDARIEKIAANELSEMRDRKAREARFGIPVSAERAKEIRDTLRANPEIGTLQRKTGVVYYVYPVGGEYVESKSLETIVAAAAANRAAKA